MLCAFEGTHAFHNFTLKVGPADPAVKRYILSFQCAGTMQLQARLPIPCLMAMPWPSWYPCNMACLVPAPIAHATVHQSCKILTSTNFPWGVG